MENKEKVLKILYRLIYIFIFLVFFIILMYIFFPYGKLKKPIELFIYDNTGLKTTINSISPALFFGVKLSGIKIFGSSSQSSMLSPYGHSENSSEKDIAHIKNIYVKNIISTAFDYLLFKKISVNLSFKDVKANSIKEGFINIPAINLKSLKTMLYIKNVSNDAVVGNSNYKLVSLRGRLWFKGDISGSLNIKKAQIKPVFEINKGSFKVKPAKPFYSKFSMFFTDIFKKGKDGYFVYDINNLVL